MPRPFLARIRPLKALTILTALTLFATPVTGQQDAPQLSDAEIAHVAVTANAIDIEMGELARSSASNQEVQAFARTMIADHTSVNQQAAALAERLGVTPADNDVSRSLREGAEAARRSLAESGAGTFDRAYMEREVAYHQAVLDALDGLLIPQTDHPELKGLLEDVRPAIAAHLEHARTILAGLGSGG